MQYAEGILDNGSVSQPSIKHTKYNSFYHTSAQHIARKGLKCKCGPDNALQSIPESECDMFACMLCACLYSLTEI